MLVFFVSHGPQTAEDWKLPTIQIDELSIRSPFWIIIITVENECTLGRGWDSF